jgi:hypothetical protein
MANKQYPCHINATQLATNWGISCEITNDKGEKVWVPARPEGFASWRHRWRMAWSVFTGKADALFWDGQ